MLREIWIGSKNEHIRLGANQTPAIFLAWWVFLFSAPLIPIPA